MTMCNSSYSYGPLVGILRLINFRIVSTYGDINDLQQLASQTKTGRMTICTL